MWMWCFPGLMSVYLCRANLCRANPCPLTNSLPGIWLSCCGGGPARALARGWGVWARVARRRAPQAVSAAEVCVLRCYFGDEGGVREGFYCTLYVSGYGNDGARGRQR